MDWLAGNGNHGKGRLWLGGVISPKRDKSLIQKLMTMVAATSQLGAIVLVVTAGGYPLGGLNLVRPWRPFGLSCHGRRDNQVVVACLAGPVCC